MDEVVDELAQHKYCAIGLFEKGFDRCESISSLRRPDIKILAYFREVGKGVPREVRVAFNASCCKISIGDTQNSYNGNQYTRATLALLA